MTVFVYISRRPKVFNRPKKRLYNPPKPSNLSWKKPLRPRGRPTRVWRAYQRRIHLRYQPKPPLPSNLSWKIPLRRRWQPRRFLAKTFVQQRRARVRYPIVLAVLVWKIPLRRCWQPRRFLNKLFVQQRRGRLRYQPFPPPPAGLAPTKRAFRIRIKRAKRFVKTPKLYSIAGPPVGFIAQKRMLRPRIKRAKFRVRPRLFPILPSLLLLYRKLPRLKIKRARRFTKLPRLYSIAGPPVGFVPTKRMWRVRIKRGRRFVKPVRYPIVKPLLVLFRKLARLKIKRGRRFTMMRRYPVMDAPAGFAPFISERMLQLHSRPLARFFRSHTRPYPIAGPPVGFIAFKKPPRPKIRRARIRVRIRPYPIVLALLVMYRALRRLKIKRAHLRVRPRAYSIAGPPVSFIAFKKPPRAKIKRFRIRIRPRSYPIVTAILVLYRALRRLKIKRGRRFIPFPRRYSIAGPPTGFIAFKKPPRAKVRRGKIDIRRFIKRFFVPFVPLPPIPPIVLPPAGGGKRKKKTAQQLEQERRNAALVEKAKQALSPGDQARAKIAAKLKVVPRQAPPLPQIVKPRVIVPRTSKPKYEPINITPEEMIALLNALQELDDDDDED